MEKVVKYLKEWFKLFLENKDIMLRRVVRISEEKDKITVEYSDKNQTFFIMPSLDDCNPDDLSEIENPSIVTFNTKENLKWLIKRWDDLVKMKTLSIYFVNPFSEFDKKWVIHPHTHSRICDEDNLERGIMTMFEMVEPTTLERVGKKI